MDLFTRAELKELLAEHRSPRVSLFMPTHRGGAEAPHCRRGGRGGRLTARLRAPAGNFWPPPRPAGGPWRNQCVGWRCSSLGVPPRSVCRVLQQGLEVGGYSASRRCCPCCPGTVATWR
jgi:hypothetical protein